MAGMRRLPAARRRRCRPRPVGIPPGGLRPRGCGQRRRRRGMAPAAALSPAGAPSGSGRRRRALPALAGGVRPWRRADAVRASLRGDDGPSGRLRLAVVRRAGGRCGRRWSRSGTFGARRVYLDIGKPRSMDNSTSARCGHRLGSQRSTFSHRWPAMRARFAGDLGLALGVAAAAAAGSAAPARPPLRPAGASLGGGIVLRRDRHRPYRDRCPPRCILSTICAGVLALVDRFLGADLAGVEDASRGCRRATACRTACRSGFRSRCGSSCFRGSGSECRA